jgi:hypothetical protein
MISRSHCEHVCNEVLAARVMSTCDDGPSDPAACACRWLERARQRKDGQLGANEARPIHAAHYRFVRFDRCSEHMITLPRVM